jgi:hypothetical protein
MVRSLGLCMLVVVPIWYLAQPPDSAEQRVRVVDQEPEIAAWQASVDPAPAPAGLPQDWRSTVAQGVRQPVGLRLGWNTPSGGYAEYSATTGATRPFVEEVTGAKEATGTVDVGGTSWQRYEEPDDGSVSLVRTVEQVTVVVGTRRSSASEDELRTLAESVRP